MTRSKSEYPDTDIGKQLDEERKRLQLDLLHLTRNSKQHTDQEPAHQPAAAHRGIPVAKLATAHVRARTTKQSGGHLIVSRFGGGGAVQRRPDPRSKYSSATILGTEVSPNSPEVI